MKPDEVKQLLGGYATGTLTPGERKTLFEAALNDPELFDALAQEQPLKEALDQPAVRRELAEILEARPGFGERFAAWFRWPYQVAAASALAVAVLTVIGIVRFSEPAPQRVHQYAKAHAPVERQLGAPEQPQAKEVSKPELLRTAPRASNLAIVKPRSAEPAAPPPPPVRLALPQAVAPPAIVTAPVMEQAATPAPSKQARNAFYGFSPRTEILTGAAGGGVTGGVVGGFPGAVAPMRSARAKTAVADMAAPASEGALGVRYSVRETQGSPAQLVVESNADAVMYLFRRDATGAWTAVTPGGMSLKAHTPTTTPMIPIDGDAALPRAVLVLSRVPLTQLAQPGKELTTALENLRTQSQSAPLLTEVTGGSTYVVTTRPVSLIVAPLALP